MKGSWFIFRRMSFLETYGSELTRIMHYFVHSRIIQGMRFENDKRWIWNLLYPALSHEMAQCVLKQIRWILYPQTMLLVNHSPTISMMTSSNGNIFRVTGHLCGEFTGPGEFPTQRPVTRSFDVFFDLRLNKRLSKQPRGWWFETPSCSLWRHRNAYNIIDVCGHTTEQTQRRYQACKALF